MTFSDFWAEWPANSATYTRKGMRGECHRRWIQRGLDLEAEAIVAHVRWLKTTEDWTKAGGQYIPAPLVYLNQSRWDGAEIPETPEAARARIAAAEAREVRKSIESAGMAAATTVRRVA